MHPRRIVSLWTHSTSSSGEERGAEGQQREGERRQPAEVVAGEGKGKRCESERNVELSRGVQHVDGLGPSETVRQNFDPNSTGWHGRECVAALLIGHRRATGSVGENNGDERSGNDGIVRSVTSIAVDVVEHGSRDVTGDGCGWSGWVRGIDQRRRGCRCRGWPLDCRGRSEWRARFESIPS